MQSMALKESNFRFARQPPIIVTWAELHLYDLPTIHPNGFVKRHGVRTKPLARRTLRVCTRASVNSVEEHAGIPSVNFG